MHLRCFHPELKSRHWFFVSLGPFSTSPHHPTMETFQNYQIRRRQVGEGNAEESQRLRNQQQIEEARRRAEDARRANDDARRANEDARRANEDTQKRVEQAEQATRQAEMDEQWRDNNDRWIGRVEASTKDVNQRVDGIEDRTNKLEDQFGDLETQQRQADDNIKGRVTIVEGKVGGIEGRVTEIGGLQHQDHEENNNMRGRVITVETGQANTNQAVAALEAKRKEMEGEIAECKNLKTWVVLGLVAVVALGGGLVLQWFFGNKGKKKRDEPLEKMEGKNRRHAREWSSRDEDADW
jgi:hypothetical protein